MPGEVKSNETLLKRRRLVEYFVAPASAGIGWVRSILTTWRGIAIVCFTMAWIIYAVITQLLLVLLLGLQFIWLPLIVIIALAALIGIPVLIFNAAKNRRSKERTS